MVVHNPQTNRGPSQRGLGMINGTIDLVLSRKFRQSGLPKSEAGLTKKNATMLFDLLAF